MFQGQQKNQFEIHINTCICILVVMCHLCHVNQPQKCCCGRIDTYPGLLIWTLIDMVFNISAFIFYCIFIGIGPQVSIVFVTMADTLLVIGIYLENTGLILLWLMILTLYIVFLLACWVALPIIVRNIFNTICLTFYKIYFFQAFGLAKKHEFHHAIVEACILHQEEKSLSPALRHYITEFPHDCNEYISARDQNDHILNVIYGTMTFIYVLPFIYVYFWMVVWSYRKSILQSSVNSVVPFQTIHRNTRTVFQLKIEERGSAASLLLGQKQFFPCQLLGLGLGVCTVKVVIEVAKVGDCLHFCFKKDTHSGTFVQKLCVSKRRPGEDF